MLERASFLPEKPKETTSPYPERNAMREQREVERRNISESARHACTAVPEDFLDRLANGRLIKILYLYNALQLLSITPEPGRTEQAKTDLILDQAALQLEKDPDLCEQFGEEALAIVASELREIPVGRLMDILVEKSLIPRDALSNSFSEIAFYSNQSLGNISDLRQKFDVKGGHDEHHWHPQPLSDAQYAHSTAGLATPDGTRIYLNLSYLTTDQNGSPLSEEQIRVNTRDVFYHEFMHTFGAPSVTSESERLTYEGLTDAMSLQVREALGENINAGEIFSAGYHQGPTLTGSLLLHLEDPAAVQQLWASYMLHDWEGVKGVIEDQWGPKVLTDAMRDFSFSQEKLTTSEEQYKEEMHSDIGTYRPLTELLSAMEPASRDLAITQLNEHSALRVKPLVGSNEEMAWRGIQISYPLGNQKIFLIRELANIGQDVTYIETPEDFNDLPEDSFVGRKSFLSSKGTFVQRSISPKSLQEIVETYQNKDQN